MLLGGITLGLAAGLLAGGNLSHLVSVRLRWMAAIFAALLVRYATELAIARGVAIADLLRLPLFGGALVLLLAGLWVNRRHPGLGLAFVGILSNTLAIVVNGGRMPILDRSLEAVGLTAADATTAFHSVIDASDPQFLLRLGPLTDIIPIPVVQDVASIGDVFLGLGLAFFLFATVVRSPDEPDELDQVLLDRRLVGLVRTTRIPRSPLGTIGPRLRAEPGPTAGLAESAAFDQTLVLGGPAPGMAPAPVPPVGGSGPVAASRVGTRSGDAGVRTTGVLGGVVPDSSGAGAIALPRPAPRTLPRTLDRVRRHPYTRLALNSSFSSLWVGNVISLFGDRVHQVALAFLVYGITGSPLAIAATFIAATLPNLLLGPLAGTLVDRWDQKEVLIVSDVLRAAAVLLIPVAAMIDVFLVFPLVFAVTTVSIFFRPAKDAVMPRLVPDDQLVAANSIRWLGETLADIVGYPLAGVFASVLGSALPLAFWFDGATYLASAVLVATIVVPAAERSEESASGEGLRAELLAGWHFLRRERVLLANTLQGVAGQVTGGVALVITPIYAATILAPHGGPDGTTSYALLETGIGIGNLVGGFLIGLAAGRLRKGPLVIAGYAVYGVCTIGLGVAGWFPAALGLMVGCGVANMVFLIPSQTLFQQRTPADMIGRVVGFRFAAVFGAMTAAMGIGGLLAATIGVQTTFLVFGGVTLIAGLAGLLVRDVREA